MKQFSFKSVTVNYQKMVTNLCDFIPIFFFFSSLKNLNTPYTFHISILNQWSLKCGSQTTASPRNLSEKQMTVVPPQKGLNGKLWGAEAQQRACSLFT